QEQDTALFAVKNSSESNDSDGDGLLDWEEALWETNPFDADSDNNGISDGKEVKRWQEENKKEYPESISEKKRSETVETSTEAFMGDILSELTAVRKQGLFIGEKEKLEISQKLEQNIFNQKITPYFTISDLTFSEDIQTYANDVIYALEEYSKSQLIGNELLMFDSLLKNEQRVLEEEQLLISIAQEYKNLAKKFVSIHIPIDMLDKHLAVANDIYAVGISIEKMANISTDPLQAFIGLFQYDTYSIEFTTSIENLTQHLDTML
ncbi:MAG: hypothetical protein ACI9AR_000601, partial [Flavobacteriaceae bacterium]